MIFTDLPKGFGESGGLPKGLFIEGKGPYQYKKKEKTMSNKPFVITEDQYSHDKMSWGKKEFIVYDNVCTPP